MFNLLTSQLPISNWASNCVDWLTEHFAGFFNLIQQGGNALMDAMTNGLVAIPMFLVIAGLFVIAVRAGRGHRRDRQRRNAGRRPVCDAWLRRDRRERKARPA